MTPGAACENCAHWRRGHREAPDRWVTTGQYGTCYGAHPSIPADGDGTPFPTTVYDDRCQAWTINPYLLGVPSFAFDAVEAFRADCDDIDYDDKLQSAMAILAAAIGYGEP
jgi:hypothetical protein